MKLSKLHSREGREEFNKLVDDIHVELISYKLYGDKDKPKKPKPLKNAKQTWVTKIIGRSASFFEMGDEIFIKMGELFCRQMSFSEPIDMMLPLSALVKKYPHKFAKIGRIGRIEAVIPISSKADIDNVFKEEENLIAFAKKVGIV